MKEAAACAASLGIGLSLGMIGAGGSILTVPIFVYILKKDPISSGVYSMFVVGISSLAGSIQSIINKLVDFRIVFLFGIPSVTGVFIARKIIFPSIPAHLFSIGSLVVSKEIFFMLCLSALMFFAAIRMLRPIDNRDIDTTVKTRNTNVFLLLLQGSLTGIITGLLGIGGGFLIVPALHFFAKLPVKTAIGTTLVIITLNSLSGFTMSYSTIFLDWILLIKFSLGAVLGILIGSRLSSMLPGVYLKKIFGWFVLLISVYIFYKQMFL